MKHVFRRRTRTVFADARGLAGLAACACALAVAATPARANFIVFSETFDTDTATTAETLDQVPGVSVTANGGLGATTTVRIRGLGGSYIGVRVDGIDERIQVPEVVRYLEARYRVEAKLGDVLIMKRVGA